MADTQEDDLFRHSTMTFGEHLEELRRRLFRAAGWLALGLVVGFIVGTYVVDFIQSPLQRALAKYISEEGRRKIHESETGQTPSDDEQLVTNGYINDDLFIEPSKVARDLAAKYPEQFRLAGSLPELRLSAADLPEPKWLAAAIHAAESDTTPTPARRIWEQLSPADRQVVTEVADADEPSPAQVDQLAASLDRILSRSDFYAPSYFDEASLSKVAKDLRERRESLQPAEVRRLNWLVLNESLPGLIEAPHPDLMPITIWHRTADDPRVRAKGMGTQEAFVIYIKAAMLTGFVLASPMIFYELWMFVAAGLYPHERRYVHIFLPFSIGLFLAGALMAFFLAFPPVLGFLLNFNRILGIEPELRISEWLSFALFLPLAFGIGFQLPLVMLFLNRIGVVSVRTYLKQWRVAVLAIFISAMVLNPSPDIYSMCLLALPMSLLYFGGVALCHYSSGRKPAGLGDE